MTVGLFVLLTLWPPVLHNLAKGQWSIFLAVGLAAGWRAIHREHGHRGGAWVGMAASFKLTPLLLLGYLGLRHRRAALAMGVTFAALTLAGAATGDTGLRFVIEAEVTAKVAQGGWRIYEVPISYNGRTYAEGKKITWRDGVRGVWCTLRYAMASPRPAAADMALEARRS